MSALSQEDPRLGLPSASSFSRDVACPGNRNLIRAMRASGEIKGEESSGSELAERGTRIHKSRETGNTFELQADELTAYNDGLKIEQQATRDWQLEFGLQNVTEGERELRLWLHHPLNMKPMLSGQLDVHFLAGNDRAIVHDWKTSSGKSAGDAEDSWQLRIQALLLWKEIPELTDIRAGFIKPEAFGKRVDYVDFNLFDLQNIERAAHYTLWQTQQPDAPVRAGDHCKYCPAKAVCEAAAKEAVSPLQELAPPAPDKITEKTAKELVRLIPIETVRTVWGKRTAIKNIMEALHARLYDLPQEELYRLDLKKTLGRSADKVRDVKLAFDALVEAGLPADTLWKCLSLSKTAVVEAFQHELNYRESMAEAVYENVLDDFIERRQGDDILKEA